jgi:hypothetical protein
MRALPSFVYGHVLGALLIGGLCGAFVDLRAVFTFGVAMAAGAAASAMVCRWWPGFDGPGWRLWLAGALGNPLLLVALGFSIDSYECLPGKRTGWDCMFSDIGPLVAGVCLLPPLAGLGLRWLWGRNPA